QRGRIAERVAPPHDLHRDLLGDVGGGLAVAELPEHGAARDGQRALGQRVGGIRGGAGRAGGGGEEGHVHTEARNGRGCCTSWEHRSMTATSETFRLTGSETLTVT